MQSNDSNSQRLDDEITTINAPLISAYEFAKFLSPIGRLPIDQSIKKINPFLKLKVRDYFDGYKIGQLEGVLSFAKRSLEMDSRIIDIKDNKLSLMNTVSK